MIIFVTGLDDSGRDDIVGMVLKGYKSMMPANTFLKAYDFIPDLSEERAVAKLSKARDIGLAKLERNMVSALKKGGNIILAAGITKSTKHGYMPMITNDFLETIKPDFIIFMEIIPQRIESYMQHEHIDWAHQRFERQTAGIFSLRAGAPLKIIKVKSGNVKDAIKDTAYALRAAME